MTSNSEPRDWPGRDSALLLRSGLVVYALLAALSLGWTWWEGRSLIFASPEASEFGVNWLRDVALGVAVGALLVALSRWLSRVTGAGRALHDALRGVLGNPGLGVCLLLAALSGFAEEAFFRSALQPHVGLVLASGLFGLAHFVPRRAFLAWPLFGFAAGLVFGSLFLITGNLVAPALAHFSVNALNLSWLVSGAALDSGSGAAGGSAL
jgi:membrane protease YdiL (CAAX protease family)